MQKFMASRCSHGSSVEVAWEELKGAVIEVANEVCTVSRRKRGAKRTKWWNEKVQKAVAVKKVTYRRMLKVETGESMQRYIEAKIEAKKVVRRAKNKEWIDVGRELEHMPRRGRRDFGSYRGRDELLRRVKDEEGMIIGDEEMVVDR